MTDDHVQYGLLVSFPDESPSFVYGFEAGKIWARLEAGTEAEFAETTRHENREVLRRMADSLGWDITLTATGIEGWDSVTFIKSRPSRERPNPRGLRLVGGSDADA